MSTTTTNHCGCWSTCRIWDRCQEWWLRRKLQRCTMENTEEFNLMGRHPAWVLEALDGDTIWVAMQPKGMKGGPRKFRIRMAGVDAPEMHPKGKAFLAAEREKVAALRSRNALWEKLRGATNVTVEIGETYKIENVTCKKNTLGFDKFGRRYVGIVRIGDVDVNHWLVQNGYAVPYDGGRKAVADY